MAEGTHERPIRIGFRQYSWKVACRAFKDIKWMRDIAISGSVCTLNRHRTAVAERSSIALSPPNARRAGLWAFQAEISDIAASTVIQAIVIV